MIYIAFDQASSIAGYSIFHNKDLKMYGKNSYDGPFFDRVSQLEEDVIQMIRDVKLANPDERVKVILEDIQMQANVETFKRLAQLQGALILSIKRETGEEPELMNAATWKSFNKIKGRGRAEQKRNAQAMVLDLYGKKATQDEADAIMIGRCASNKEMHWG